MLARLLVFQVHIASQAGRYTKALRLFKMSKSSRNALQRFRLFALLDGRL